jgi:hypothetical protein
VRPSHYRHGCFKKSLVGAQAATAVSDQGVSIRDWPEKPFRGTKKVRLRIAIDFRSGFLDPISDYRWLFQATLSYSKLTAGSNSAYEHRRR